MSRSSDVGKCDDKSENKIEQTCMDLLEGVPYWHVWLCSLKFLIFADKTLFKSDFTAF